MRARVLLRKFSPHRRIRSPGRCGREPADLPGGTACARARANSQRHGCTRFAWICCFDLKVSCDTGGSRWKYLLIIWREVNSNQEPSFQLLEKQVNFHLLTSSIPSWFYREFISLVEIVPHSFPGRKRQMEERLEASQTTCA